jgi:FkbM family methyltransferase
MEGKTRKSTQMKGLRTILARIKRKLFQQPFIKDKRYTAYWMDRLLDPNDTFLVQIGSNDGKTGDPLYPLLQKHQNWKALFVEPVPYSFKKLKENYPDSNRFRFENVAINEGTSMVFYWVDSKAKETLPDLPYWFDQLGSFDKTHITKHFDGALAPFVKSTLLEGLNLKTLFQRNNISNISVLHIDTEGYDWKILSQLDLNQFEPRFILFEQNHLSKEEREEAISFLDKKYHVLILGIDMLAVHKSLPEQEVIDMKKRMGTKILNEKPKQ